MSTIQLGYGNASMELEYEPSRFDILAPQTNTSHPLSDSEINAALDTPIESPSLDDLIDANDSVLIVVSDATRATGSAQIVNLLVRRLIESGVTPANITIIFATGIHRAVRPEEKIQLLTSFIAHRIDGRWNTDRGQSRTDRILESHHHRRSRLSLLRWLHRRPQIHLPRPCVRQNDRGDAHAGVGF